ncbi:MAG: AzlD domain-containing protein [Crenarchaeota archaeon]|nr:AzlD domain-containing protein [Thermoproteota archaeon]
MIAIVCVAVVTYLARYLPLRYGHKITRIERVSHILRNCTIAIIASLVALSLVPSYLSHNIDIVVPTTLGVIISVVLARRLRNVGIVAVIGLLTYLAAYSLLKCIVL